MVLRVLPSPLAAVAVRVFCPRVSGTDAVQLPLEAVAATPFTVTPLTPDGALAVTVTVAGVRVTVPPGDEITTRGACIAACAAVA